MTLFTQRGQRFVYLSIFCFTNLDPAHTQNPSFGIRITVMLENQF